MKKRRTTSVFVLVVLVEIAFSIVLIAPLSGSVKGILGQEGVYRSKWGLLDYLTVRSDVTLYDAGDLIQYRAAEWNPPRAVVTLVLLIATWILAFYIIRRVRRAG